VELDALFDAGKRANVVLLLIPSTRVKTNRFLIKCYNEVSRGGVTLSNKELRICLLEQLKQLIFDVLSNEDVKIYLFGSWARGEEKQSSDIDIAIEPVSEIPPSKWIELVEVVEESAIPFKVDLVNLNNASQQLVNNVKKEGVLWKD
jgi:predicted nucleotidyltransferase